MGVDGKADKIPQRTRKRKPLGNVPVKKSVKMKTKWERKKGKNTISGTFYGSQKNLLC